MFLPDCSVPETAGEPDVRLPGSLFLHGSRIQRIHRRPYVRLLDRAAPANENYSSRVASRVGPVRVCGWNGTCTIDEPPESGVSIVVELYPFGERSQILANLRSISLRLNLGKEGTRDIPITGAYASRGMGKKLLLCGRLDGVTVADVYSLVIEIGGDAQHVTFS